MNELPMLVMPMNDVQGVYFPLLKAMRPMLPRLFAQTFVSIPPSTRRSQAANVAWLDRDDFFQILFLDEGLTVGDEFRALFAWAAASCPAQTILHLANVDRLAFAVQTEHHDHFIADIESLRPDDVPLIFQRSSAAWATHPANYRDIEQMVSQVGRHLFCRTLDFTWCHLVLLAGQLADILPSSRQPGISMTAELVLALRHTMNTREVDWLAWEDPYVLGRPADDLRRERENSVAETLKRLGYVLPMLEMLAAAGLELD